MIQNKKLQEVHEEACLKSSAALAKLIGQQTVIDIVNLKAKKVKELAQTVDLDKTAVMRVFTCKRQSRRKGSADVFLGRCFWFM